MKPTAITDLDLRDTWSYRLGDVVLAALYLALAAGLLGVAIMALITAVPEVRSVEIGWPLVGTLVLAVVAGAGTFWCGRESARSALRSISVWDRVVHDVPAARESDNMQATRFAPMARRADSVAGE